MLSGLVRGVDLGEVAVNAGGGTAEGGRGAFNGALQQKNAGGFQRSDDLKPLAVGEVAGRDPHPFQLPVDGVQSHRICGVAEFFRGGSGGYVIFTLWQRLCQHIGYEQVRVAQLQDMVADGPIAAVVKVDAQQADELAAVLDEKGAGSEVFSVDVDAVIVEMIVRMLIALVPENTQDILVRGAPSFLPLM